MTNIWPTYIYFNNKVFSQIVKYSQLFMVFLRKNLWKSWFIGYLTISQGIICFKLKEICFLFIFQCLIVNKYQYDNKQYAWKRYKTSFYHQNLEAKNIYMYKCIMFVILFESGYSCQLIWTSIKLYIVPCLSVYL